MTTPRNIKSEIEELIAKGVDQGYLTLADVNDHLPEDLIDADEMENIIGMINDMGIQVYEEAPDAEVLLMSDAPPAVTDEDAMNWGLKLSKLEGLIPAIETAHAFAVLDMMPFKPTDIVVINLSGRGDKDLNTYIDYFKL